jgi:nucleotide-binding universal stress UspA family protein
MVTARGGGGDRRIVVGVDGSAASKAALAWAIGQAKLTGAAVEAVTAWEIPLAFRTPIPPGLITDFRQQAVDELAETVADLSGPADKVEIRSKVMEGNAAEVLVNESDGADLLVVGSRGRSGFTRALLGSVGQHCVHHAVCPVVIIRNSGTENH